MSPGCYQFGPFRLDTAECRLLHDGQPIPLTPKAYETLVALLENAGRALSKEELMQRVWPDTFVTEVSLARNISVLRKALGDDDGRYIETQPKRGYRFAAAVTRSNGPAGVVLVDEGTLERVVIEETETSYRLPAVIAAGACILVLLAAAAIVYSSARKAPQPPIRTLAVLPLKNLTGGPDDKYLELGMADSIIGKVSELPGLTVRPIGAVRQYATAQDPARAARELKVEAVLDGTLQILDGRLRVSLNLLQFPGGSSLWTQAFEVPLRDLFQVQDEVARQVAAGLCLRLDPARQRKTGPATRNVEAYQHYLKGLYSNEGPAVSSRAAVETAIIRFQKATELDPSFAQAWAQLAVCYAELVIFHESDQTLAEASRQAASRAYALDPNLPELLVFRAQTLWSWSNHYQIEEAMRELRRGAGFNDADVRSLLGILYAHVGLDRQAIAEVERGVEIDPANSLYLDRLAQAFVLVGRDREATATFQRAFTTESEDRADLVASAIPYVHDHQFEQARRRLQKAHEQNPRHGRVQATLALIAALEDRFPEAEAAIPADVSAVAKLRGGHHVFHTWAEIFALQGKSAEAVRWLRLAVDGGLPNYPLFERDPYLDRIRQSPEFTRFMAELKPRWTAIQREFH